MPNCQKNTPKSASRIFSPNFYPDGSHLLNRKWNYFLIVSDDREHFLAEEFWFVWRCCECRRAGTSCRVWNLDPEIKIWHVVSSLWLMVSSEAICLLMDTHSSLCAIKIWGSSDWHVDSLTCLNKYTHGISPYYLVYGSIPEDPKFGNLAQF